MGSRKVSVLPERQKPEEKVVSIVKDLTKGVNKSLDNISTEQRVKAVKPFCPEDIMAIKSSEGALSRTFNIGNFNAPNKMHIQIRGYVDFYGGYAKHTREVLRYMEQTDKVCMKLTPIPSPRDIDPIMACKMDWYASNPSFIVDGSQFLVIAGPGHMREDKISKDTRRKIGWTMIESRGVQPRIVEWLNNMDEIWAPTITDLNRFQKAGVKNVYRVPLGYDPTMWHQEVTPMNLQGLNNGRFVFGVLGSWNVRKGIKDIVQAYVKAFNKHQPVTLLMVCKYGTRKWGSQEDMDNDEKWSIKYELNQYLQELGMSREDCPHIAFIDVPLHPNVIPHVVSRFDSLVGFSKGESTFLPGLEVGAMHKPIIQLASDCSGFMEYLADNRYMCKDVSYKIADEELYAGTSEYYEGEEMAHGNQGELTEMMKQVLREHGSVTQQQNSCTIFNEHIAHRTWNKVTEIILDRL